MDHDDTLMRAIARGDESAFEEIVARHEARMWRIAAGVLGNREEARDMVQQAFLRLLEAAPGYRAEGRFTGWLRILVTRLCLDFLRRGPPEPQDRIELRGDPEAADPARRVVEEAEHLELRRFVTMLPPRQRLAVVLRYDEGCSYVEIAAALGDGVGPKVVERLLERARRSLAEQLSRREKKDGDERGFATSDGVDGTEVSR